MTVLTDTFILRQAPRGDYDLAVTAYTSEQGKILAIAKGAKKMISKLRPHLEFFCLARLMVAPGSGAFRIAGATINRNFRGAYDTPGKAVYALAYLEAIDALTPRQAPDPELFRLINKFFGRFDVVAGAKQSRLAFNQALYDLLAHLGWRPRLKSQSQKQLTAELARLVIAAGEKELKSLNLLLRQK